MLTIFNSCSSPVHTGTTDNDLSQERLLESRIVRSVNRERVAVGLEPLKMHSAMATVARKHSIKLRDGFLRTGKRPLNHKGFGGRANAVLLDFSMASVAENVAYIFYEKTADHAASFTRNWMNSPSHKVNIMKKFNYTGVGVAVAPDGTTYATQLFGLKEDYTFGSEYL